jgi:predicted nucleic acid-binding protein
MAILVDANVLLDILTADPVWLAWSAAELQKAQAGGPLIINPLICAEIAPAFDCDWARLDLWLRPASFVREALPYEASPLAAAAHLLYRNRGGSKRSPMPDFYIGAHAQACGHTVLTRDAKRYRTYFPSVPLITPL